MADSQTPSSVLSADYRLLVASLAGDKKDVLKALADNADVDAVDKTGMFMGTTPLCATALHGHIDICRQLLTNGANANKTDEKGGAPLFHAARQGHIDICRLLLASKVSCGMQQVCSDGFVARLQPV